VSGEGDRALRAEHDQLAARLAVRRSIDHVRRGAYGLFFSVVTGGLAGKLAYDRWFSTRVTRFRGPPIFFFAAAAAALALVAYSAWSFVRARRHMAEEDRAFARMRELRQTLGLDP
jgi:type VI protein secretion system component VasK